MSDRQPSGCLGAIFTLIQHSQSSQTAHKALPYKRRDWFFSKAERSFFGVLQQAVGDRYVIFSKVRLADLLYMSKGTENRQGMQNRINSKHVDFVLCSTDTVAPLLVIELDDASHKAQHRRKRDEFVDAALTAAGLPILHVPAAYSYQSRELFGEIDRAINPQRVDINDAKSNNASE